MAFEDMSVDEVLVRYLHNIAEIKRLDSENAQIIANKDSIEEPRYVEDLSQWGEYQAAKQEIERLTDERINNNNDRKRSLLQEQKDIRAFLLNNENVPKNKWIRCAGDGVFIHRTYTNGDPEVRVAPSEHVVETNGEPERLAEMRHEKRSETRTTTEPAVTGSRLERYTPLIMIMLLVIGAIAVFNGSLVGVAVIVLVAMWWYLGGRSN